MSARRLALLVKNLPVDSATITSAARDADPARQEQSTHEAPRDLSRIPVVSLSAAAQVAATPDDEFDRAVGGKET